MAHKAPGKSFRKGVSLPELFRMFPDDDAARDWFELARWGGTPWCPHCASLNVQCGIKHKSMTHRCREKECGKRFSVKVGTPLYKSKIGYQGWAVAIYLLTTSLKGVSSMKLHRDLNITQKSAWFLAHRIREAWGAPDTDGGFSGPVEVDEAFFGGKRKNMSNAKRAEIKDTGRGPVGKTAVVGLKDRETNKVSAQVVDATDAQTLIPFVESQTADGATIYTDDASAYSPLPTMFNRFEHESVKHSVGEYVRGMAHTNGVESFWATMKRGHKGVYHKMSPKHLDRYVHEFAGRHNARCKSTLMQMAAIVRGLEGKRLPYSSLKAENGRDAGARA